MKRKTLAFLMSISQRKFKQWWLEEKSPTAMITEEQSLLLKNATF